MNEDVNQTFTEINRTLGNIRDSLGSDSVNSNYRNLGAASNTSESMDQLNSTLSRTLADRAGQLSSGFDDRTIMETFADRRRLAQEGGGAERDLIQSRSQDNIQDQLSANARSFVDAVEGRTGFATKTAAVRYLEDSGAKRIRDLEKQRDSMLLESKVMEASRLDNLIAQEQEAITKGREAWLNEVLSLGRETRAIAQEERDALSFETPEEARERDFAIAERQAVSESVRNLALSAPEANILPTDSFEDAVAKYRNSTTYQNNQRLGELEISQAEANIAQTRASTANIYDTMADRTLRREASEVGEDGSLDSEGARYEAEKALRTLGAVENIRGRVSNTTVGPAGVAQANIPGTPAYDMKAWIETLRANISFGELTAMRNASKTGGALGNVSNAEMRLLGASLGALDQGMSPTEFRKALDTIESSLRRWNNALLEYSETGATGTGSTGSIQSTGSGNMFDGVF